MNAWQGIWPIYPSIQISMTTCASAVLASTSLSRWRNLRQDTLRSWAHELSKCLADSDTLITTSRLPLNALRTFAAAARHLSFKAAAELCVCATTVSNQLFVRKTRAVILTEAGRAMARTLTRAFAEIRAEVDTHVAASARIVQIAVGPIFGARWLVTRLPGFRALHPRTELVLHHAPRITGIDTMPTSIAVDWGRGEWPGLRSAAAVPDLLCAGSLAQSAGGVGSAVRPG